MSSVVSMVFGMVTTTSENPPDLALVRCVPSSWCTVTKFVPVKVWDDSGAGGGKPGSIWVVNPHGLVAFTVGHDAPKGNFYEISGFAFSLEEYGVKG
jgi:hypothetical protein